MSLFTRVLPGLAATFLTATGCLADPAVAVAPSVGPPTTKVTVTGTGFTPFAAVDIYFDTADLCLAVATVAGAISCAIKAPEDAQPQSHWISAILRVAGTGAQKSFLVRTDMAQFHGRNALHNGVNPFENTLDTSNIGSLDVLWRKPIGPLGTAGSAVVAGGIVYVGGLDGKLYAFKTTTGAPQAGFPVNVGSTMNYGTPAVGGGRVFIGASEGLLHAYNSTTGAAVSGFPIYLGCAIYSSPALALGNVYVGCTDGKLYAFNATTGAPVSGFPVTAGGDLFGSPTIFDGKVFATSENNFIYGFDALTGAALSGYPISLSTGYHIEGAVAAASGQGYVGSTDGNLYDITLDYAGTNGVFPAPTGGAIRSTPAVADGKVIVSSTDGKLYAFHTNDLSLAWSTVVEGNFPIFGSPMVANGVIYVAGDRWIHALALSTGRPLWDASGITGFTSSPVVADGTVYFADASTGTTGGHLTAYSVNGLTPAAMLPGGALGVKPALAALKPDLSLKPASQ